MTYRGGCAPGMPTRGACLASCLHRASVLSYRDWRDAWEQLEGTNHQMEPEEFRTAYPPPTFRAWLEGHAARREHE